MTKKFSELVSITTPDISDVFALSDVSETESKKITFADLKSSIIDEGSFDQALLVSRLNTYNPTNAGN